MVVDGFGLFDVVRSWRWLLEPECRCLRVAGEALGLTVTCSLLFKRGEETLHIQSNVRYAIVVGDCSNRSDVDTFLSRV